jgi:hypothetical protein
VQALPLWIRIGEIMERRASLGYQLYRHNPILAADVSIMNSHESPLL